MNKLENGGRYLVAVLKNRTIYAERTRENDSNFHSKLITLHGGIELKRRKEEESRVGHWSVGLFSVQCVHSRLDFRSNRLTFVGKVPRLLLCQSRVENFKLQVCRLIAGVSRVV